MSAKTEGLTLLELLIVLAILGVLVGLVTFRAPTLITGAQAMAARGEKE